MPRPWPEGLWSSVGGCGEAVVICDGHEQFQVPPTDSCMTQLSLSAMLAVPLGKCILKRGKNFVATRSEGKCVMNSPVTTWSKEEGKKYFRCWSRDFAAFGGLLWSRWIFPEGLHLLEGPHGSRYF